MSTLPVIPCFKTRTITPRSIGRRTTGGFFIFLRSGRAGGFDALSNTFGGEQVGPSPFGGV